MSTATPTGRRKAVEQWPVTVVRAEHVAPSVRRITLTAPQLSEYVRTGPDEYFGLMVPREGDRPALRWYSMRALRTEQAEVDVDIVLHGTEGPGTAWALSTQPGDQLPFRVGGADYQLPLAEQHQLIVGDETSMPAVWAIIEAYDAAGRPGTLHVVVETPDADHDTPFTTDLPLVRLHRGADAPGTLAITHVEHWDLPPLDFAWLCGESKLATTLRRHVIKDRGIDRKAVAFSGYWRHQ